MAGKVWLTDDAERIVEKWAKRYGREPDVGAILAILDAKAEDIDRLVTDRAKRLTVG